MLHRDSPAFTFDPETHIYRVGERVYPHVTGIINAIAPRQYSCGDWYLSRGRAMHKAIHLLVKGILDWSSVDERILPRIRAFEKFMRERQWQLTHSELPLVSKSLLIAGTVDAILEHEGRDLVLTDFKSSLEPHVSVQLGLYYRLLRDNGIEVSQGLALELRDDGNYRCQWFNKREMKRAEQTGHAFLSTYNWLAKNNLLGGSS